MIVVFRGTDSVISFVIGIVTWSFAPHRGIPKWMSHSLIIAGDTVFEASGKLGKVVTYPVSKMKDKADDWEWWVDISPLLSPAMIAAGRAYLETRRGLDYDYAGGVGYALNQPQWASTDKDFCFELVRNAFPAITSKRPERTVGRHIWRGLKRLAKQRGLDFKALVTYR